MERYSYSQSQVKTCIPIPALVARAVLLHAFTVYVNGRTRRGHARRLLCCRPVVDRRRRRRCGRVRSRGTTKRKAGPGWASSCVVRVALRSPEVGFGPVGRPSWRTPWASRPFGFSFFFLPQVPLRPDTRLRRVPSCHLLLLLVLAVAVAVAVHGA